MSRLLVPSVIAETPAGLPSLRIAYSKLSAAELLAEPDVLAVIGFGATADIPDDPRAMCVGLDPIGATAFEVWRTHAAVRSGRDGNLRWSTDGDYRFVSIEVDETAHGGIAEAAELAYRTLIEFVHASDTPHVLRLWNYLDAINVGDGDDERYRHFCVGRARGIGESWRHGYPAATAIGRRDGVRTLQVYALAARQPGVPVENPRQVSAWRYPRQYGPIAPTFARGMLTPAGQLLISGTAAVVGSASQHRDDASGQIDETLANIASLISTAGNGAAPHLGRHSVLKAYLRDPSYAPIVSAALQKQGIERGGWLLLSGDICRRELLLEIDGLHA